MDEAELEKYFNSQIVRTSVTAFDPETLAVLQKESKREEKSIKYYLYYFSSSTKAHGVLRIASAINLKSRLLWTTFMLIVLIGLMVHFVLLLLKYLSNEIETEIISDATKFVMPILFFCPNYPFAKRLKDDNFHDLYGMTTNNVYNKVNQFWTMFNSSNHNIHFTTRLSMAPHIYQQNLTILLYDWFIFCKNNGIENCDIEPFLTNDLQTCLRIKIPESSINKLSRNNLINIAFFTHPSNANLENVILKPELFNSRTPYLIFSQDGIYPDIYSGRIISLGWYGINVKVQISSQQNLNINDVCKTNLGDYSILNHNNQVTKYKYSKYLCEIVEQQRKLLNICNCYSELLPIPIDEKESRLNIENIPFCHKIPMELIKYLNSTSDLSNKTMLLNVNNVPQMLTKTNCFTTHYNEILANTKCKEPCNTIKYDYKNANYYRWPSLQYKKTDNFTYPYVQRNLKILSSTYNKNESEFYFDRINKMELCLFTIQPLSSVGIQIIERVAYPLNNFLSSIGSILGLWIGVSVITILELFELFMLVTHNLISKCTKKY